MRIDSGWISSPCWSGGIFFRKVTPVLIDFQQLRTVATPADILPFSYASGIFEFASIIRFAPPANAWIKDNQESVVLTLAFMALARIRNSEQRNQCKPGEIGRIIGLDKIPEVRCLREKRQRIESKFYPLVGQAIDNELEIIPKIANKQMQ
jgi:hypothetical protein